MLSYLNDPEKIYQLSYATIEAETDLSRFPHDLRSVVVRLIHACGMTDIVEDLAWSDDIVVSVCGGLSSGVTILVDSEMVRVGLGGDKSLRIVCTLSETDNIPTKKTRSASAVELWRPYLAESIVVIGVAPTALFALLDMIEQYGVSPLAILAFPVGFVGAVESKQRLLEQKKLHIPYLTLTGRRGGSALAVAALRGFVEVCSR